MLQRLRQAGMAIGANRFIISSVATCVTAYLHPHICIVFFTLLTSLATNIATSILFSQGSDPPQNDFISVMQSIALIGCVCGVAFYMFGILSDEIVTKSNRIVAREAQEFQEPRTVRSIAATMLEAQPETSLKLLGLLFLIGLCGILLCCGCLSVSATISQKLHERPLLTTDTHLRSASTLVSPSETQALADLLY